MNIYYLARQALPGPRLRGLLSFKGYEGRHVLERHFRFEVHVACTARHH